MRTTQWRRRWDLLSKIWDFLQTRMPRWSRKWTNTSKGSKLIIKKMNLWKIRSTNWHQKTSAWEIKSKMLKSLWDFLVPLRPNFRENSLRWRAELLKTTLTLRLTESSCKNWWPKTLPWSTKLGVLNKTCVFPQELSTNWQTNWR